MIIGSEEEGGIPTRETASIEYITADKAIVTYDGRSIEVDAYSIANQENWTAGGENSAGGPLQEMYMSDAGDAVRWIELGNASLYDPSIPLASGTFGFATPENRLTTGSANYSSTFGSDVLITKTDWIEQDDGSFQQVDGVAEVSNGIMNITANFDSGTVSGTLFDGSYSTTDERQAGAHSVSH